MQVETRPVEGLIPYARNARTHSEDQVAQIAASIGEFGFVNPILVGPDGVIIAGHGRLMAARRLGMKEVPVIALGHLTEAQRRALVIADNRIALNAGWDEELLKLELADLAGLDFNIDLLGFSDEELNALLEEAVPEGQGLTDEDETPEAQEKAVSQAGDVWVLGNHRIMCGSSTDAMNVAVLLDGVKPHLMVTDPPYGVNYDANWRSSLDAWNRATGNVRNDDKADWRDVYSLFPGDVAYVWHAGLHCDVVAQGLRECGFQLRSQIVWVKPHFVLSRGHYHLQHESCFYAVRSSGHWTGDRKQSTVWHIANRTFQGGEAKPEDSRTGHGTQKPVECMRRPIENNSSPGQVVYEPFSGSGTTIIAAEQTGRHCYAMEIEPLYVDMAVRRWQNFTGQRAKLEGDGRSFAEIEAARA